MSYARIMLAVLHWYAALFSGLQVIQHAIPAAGGRGPNPRPTCKRNSGHESFTDPQRTPHLLLYSGWRLASSTDYISGGAERVERIWQAQNDRR